MSKIKRDLVIRNDLVIYPSNTSVSSLAKSYLPDRVHDAVPRKFGKINPFRCAQSQCRCNSFAWELHPTETAALRYRF